MKYLLFLSFIFVIFPFHVDKYFQLCDKHQPAEKKQQTSKQLRINMRDIG